MSKGEKAARIHIKTDRSIPGAAIAVFFSEDVEIPSDDNSPDVPLLRGSPISQLQWSRIEHNGVPDLKSYVALINAPSAFLPGQELIIAIRSKKDARVMSLISIQPTMK